MIEQKSKKLLFFAQITPAKLSLLQDSKSGHACESHLNFSTSHFIIIIVKTPILLLFEMASFRIKNTPESGLILCMCTV